MANDPEEFEYGMGDEEDLMSLLDEAEEEDNGGQRNPNGNSSISNTTAASFSTPASSLSSTASVSSASPKVLPPSGAQKLQGFAAGISQNPAASAVAAQKPQSHHTTQSLGGGAGANGILAASRAQVPSRSTPPKPSQPPSFPPSFRPQTPNPAQPSSASLPSSASSTSSSSSSSSSSHSIASPNHHRPSSSGGGSSFQTTIRPPSPQALHTPQKRDLPGPSTTTPSKYARQNPGGESSGSSAARPLPPKSFVSAQNSPSARHHQAPPPSPQSAADKRGGIPSKQNLLAKDDSDAMSLHVRGIYGTPASLDGVDPPSSSRHQDHLGHHVPQSSHETGGDRTPKRKLPGPVGQLPPLSDHEKAKILKSAEASKKLTSEALETKFGTPEKKQRIFEQSFSKLAANQEYFAKGAWVTALKALEIPPYYTGEITANSESNAKVLARFTAANLNKDKGIARAQYSVLLIKDLKPSEANVRVRFADPSGEISGTLHKKVVDEYAENLKIGSVLVMKKISIYRPKPSTAYLNITKENIMNIFAPESKVSSQSSEDQENLSSSTPNDGSLKKLSQESFPDMPDVEDDQVDPEQLVPPAPRLSQQKGLSQNGSQLSPLLFSRPDETQPEVPEDDEDYDALLEDIDESEFDTM